VLGARNIEANVDVSRGVLVNWFGSAGSLPTSGDVSCRETHLAGRRGHLEVKGSKARGRFDVTAERRGMTGLSGTSPLAETACWIGLIVGLSTAVGRWCPRRGTGMTQARWCATRRGPGCRSRARAGCV
jgi:hypothetical protein